MRQSRREFLGSVGVAALGCGVIGAGAVSRPNILFLLGDDHRWDVLGAAGNPVVQTPNLDALAVRGTRFTHAFVTTAICMASRATILTGQFTSSHGITDFTRPLSAEQLSQTYPLLLRDAGYHTGFIGKWGVGSDAPPDAFDYVDAFPGQGKYLHEVDGVTHHLTNLQADSAETFLANAPADRPFCLSVSFKAPHAQDEDVRQFVYDPMLQPLYSDVRVPVAETAEAQYFDAMPEFIRKSEGRTRWEKRFTNAAHAQQSIKAYYRLVTGIDLAVGRMIRALERSGRLENTIVVYAGDNGMFLGEHGLTDKWLMHEESIRVPLIAAGPGISQQVRDEMVLSNDIAPTLLALADVEPLGSMEGRSLVPLLRGETPAWREEWFYEHHYAHGGRIPESEGIRTKEWKYIRYMPGESPRPSAETLERATRVGDDLAQRGDPGVHDTMLAEELYRVSVDPLEKENLAGDAAHADVLNGLRERWKVWREHLLNAPRPWREPEGVEHAAS